MFTKKAFCFTSKSALLGVALSSMLFATTTSAAPLIKKGEVKTPLPRHLSSSKKHASKSKKKQRGRARVSRIDFSEASLSRTTQEPSPIQAQSPTILPLGSFTLRAYTHSPSSNKTPPRTATGTIPSSERTVAVDPRVIPFGTKIYIEGLGERIAEDSGANIKGRQLDVFLPTVEHCRNFGVQTRDVEAMIE